MRWEYLVRSMKRLIVTVDTNILGDVKINKLKASIKDKDIEVALVSVSEREISGTTIKPLPNKILETGVWNESQWGNCVWGDTVNETLVLGESKLGSSVLASSNSTNMFEELLKIISSGGFPKPGARNNLTKGQKHLLRDVMILEAHWRSKRDILVSDDLKAYVGKDGKLRSKLEKLCETKIMTFDEFLAYIEIIK